MRNGTLLPVYENDPTDIKIVFDALKIIDLQNKNSVGEECVIEVQDCGAAYRFLMALLAVTPGKWFLTGTPRLLERPVLPLVNFLNTKGAAIKQTEAGWQIEGRKMQIDDIEIDFSESSQFISAVMMIHTGCRLGRYRNPYIQMTETILQADDFSPFLQLADWSAAVFWLANALLIPNAHYLLKNLHFDRVQGDAEIVPWFQKWGLSFTECAQGIEVKHNNPINIPKQKIEVTQTPDIAMILAVLAVYYPFELTMVGLKNLNLKESNRLDILVNELSKFTKVMKHSDDTITIHKRAEELPKTFHFDSYNDHRFVMAWSLFKNYGTVKIENSECVRKSYPDFCKIT